MSLGDGELGLANGMARRIGLSCNRITFAAALRGILLLYLFYFAALAPARAEAQDPLDVVPIEQRARLAVAACVAAGTAVEFLDPDNPGFKPQNAVGYLTTDIEGQLYAGERVIGVLNIYYSIVQYADAAAAAKGLEHWKSEGPSRPLVWGGPVAAFERGQNLLGVEVEGGSMSAVAQDDRWHFEIIVYTVVMEPDPGPDAKRAAIAEAMTLLYSKAERYRLFENQLFVTLLVDKQPIPLLRGQRFTIPFKLDEETEAALELQLKQKGKGQAGTIYTVELTGPLADVATLIKDGSRERRNLVEMQSADGEPVTAVWMFPREIDPVMTPLLQSGNLGLGLRIEAKPPPTVLP